MRFARCITLMGAAAIAATPAEASETITYSYDEVGRLVKVARAGTVNNGVSACYSYDNADNRTNVTVETAANCAAGTGVSFTIASNGAITEGANSVFTVTKTGTATGSLTVNYASSNGTAVQPGDYTATSGTLSFLTGDTSKTITLPTTDDAISESVETVVMTLSSPSGLATLGTPSSANGTINDNENNPPIAVNDSGSQQKCTDATYNVIANDTDPEGDYPLTVISVTGNRFSVVSSTSIQYSALQSGGTGTYTVRDSRGATSTATLAVSVTGTCQ